MISRRDLKELLAEDRLNGTGVLSVYLDVDQGRAVNLNRGFESAFRSLIQNLDRSLTDDNERKSLLSVAQKAGSFLSDYEPVGKSLVLFRDLNGKLDWHRSLLVSMSSQVMWSRRPFLRPLFEVRDEFERYGVILTDRARARLFSVFLGSIEEEKEALATSDVRKFDSPGTDQMLSQMNLQRKADEHARWHLKHVASLMSRWASSMNFDRLVLGGTNEVVSELKGLLPEHLRRIVIGSVAVPMDAGTAAILEATVSLQKEVERVGESTLVKDLLTAAAKGHQAVVGLNGTVEALREGRVHKLVYTDRLSGKGSECQECGRVFLTSGGSCLFCGSDLHPFADLVEAVTVATFRDGGEIEHIKSGASSELDQVGEGIGAFLRF